AAFPQKKQHRADLPYAVRDLSRLLTSERDQKRAYWASPRLLGAYLHYFLPWNLVRLSWLLPSLPLRFSPGDKILDLGAGPLTLPLGLWLARPELHALPLEVTCSDQATHPLQVGRDILRRLLAPEAGPEANASVGPDPGAGAGPEQGPWRLNLLRAPLEQALRKAGSRVNLITALNVLNELPTPRQQSLEDRLSELFASFNRALEPGGGIFLLEPGTRLGGKLVQLMRKLALEEGYAALSPCPHQTACPFLRHLEGRDKIPPGPPGPTGWCHFGHGIDGATPELLKLSTAADLRKERLNLSFVLLRKPGGAPGGEADKTGGSGLEARVISEPIRLPGGSARYVCTGEGLGLLRGAGHIPSGAKVAAVKAGAGRDAKSGAIFLELAAPAPR
ncbi:MAG: hypothetical protein LBM64_10375, partial [Deltaproteobacteria bacterium]|nr:hypothetical protein [Deltaproteobacteria bacterium]